MQPVRLANTRISTDYVQKSPRSLMQSSLMSSRMKKAVKPSSLFIAVNSIYRSPPREVKFLLLHHAWQVLFFCIVFSIRWWHHVHMIIWKRGQWLRMPLPPLSSSFFFDTQTTLVSTSLVLWQFVSHFTVTL
jgi:hypothetical protein